jgi:hypothetical protein
LLCEKVVTPIVLGMFANDEWDSIAMLRDDRRRARLIARIVVCGEDVEVVLDYPGKCTRASMTCRSGSSTSSNHSSKRSEFGARRDDEWEAGFVRSTRTNPAVVNRTPRPHFAVPPDCVQRRLRNRGRVMRVDRRRCVSAHRRS